MSTLASESHLAQHDRTTDCWSLATGGQLDSTANSSPVGLILLVVAVVLLFIALRQLRRALLPIAELMRMVLSASLVAVLILGAVVLLVTSAFMRR
jgi:hypothetical protein